MPTASRRRARLSPIAEQVQRGGFAGPQSLTAGVFSVSENGVLAYQMGRPPGNVQLAWFDRSGKQLGVLGDQADYRNVRLSTDGKRASVVIIDPQSGRADIWIYEVTSDRRTRFTFDPAEERASAWSPDGSRIAFSSNRQGHFDIYQKDSSGAGSEELLLESDVDKYPTSFSTDGRFLLYWANGLKTGADLWILPLSGDRKPFPFLQTEFPGRQRHVFPRRTMGRLLLDRVWQCRALCSFLPRCWRQAAGIHFGR
jgi:dipeptidyl aminopeptidase/acylaminoacyl peptidase